MHPSHEHAAAADSSPPTESDAGRAVAHRRTRWGAALAMFCFGLLAGVGAAVATGNFRNYFQLPEHLQNLPSPIPADMGEEVSTETAIADWRNTVLVIGMIGAITAAALGFGQGVVSRSPGRAVAGLCAGALLGVLLGALGGVTTAYFWMDYDHMIEDASLRAMVMHGLSWTGVALAVALATTLAAGRGGKLLPTFVAALAAGWIAALLFPFLAAILFPKELPDLPLPRGDFVTYLWTTMLGGLMGLAVGRSLNSTSAAPAHSPATTAHEAP